MPRPTEAPVCIFLFASLVSSFRKMPCFSVWLSEGLRALLVTAFVWRHLPFSGPFRHRICLFRWHFWLQDHICEAQCVIDCAWALHMSICLKLVGSLRLPGLQSEGQLSHPSRKSGEKRKSVPTFPSTLPVGALGPQQQQL